MRQGPSHRASHLKAFLQLGGLAKMLGLMPQDGMAIDPTVLRYAMVFEVRMVKPLGHETGGVGQVQRASTKKGKEEKSGCFWVQRRVRRGKTGREPGPGAWVDVDRPLREGGGSVAGRDYPGKELVPGHGDAPDCSLQLINGLGMVG